MCFNSGARQTRRMAQQQRADEQARQGRIRTGMGRISDAFSGFNDQFFADRANDYVAFAQPQLDRQAKDLREQLIFALARTGNLDSSAANDKNKSLTREINDRRVGIANDGLNQANALRNQVESARSQTVAQLNATADDQASAQAAMRLAENLNMPVGYSPLGQMFATFADSVSRIGSNAGNNFGGFLGIRQPGFGGGGSSMRVVNG